MSRLVFYANLNTVYLIFEVINLNLNNREVEITALCVSNATLILIKMS